MNTFFLIIREEKTTNLNFSLIYLKADSYLTHYWPICNSQMTDLIGLAHMQQGENTTFTSDRFDNPDSALALNGGWTYVSSGVYFSGPQFSITLWVFPKTVGSWARIIDFGTVNGDIVVISLSESYTNKPYFGIFTSTNIFSNTTSTQPLTLNNWQFLAATFDGSSLLIYINGVLTGSTSVPSFTSLAPLTRTNNYIGKSNWNDDGYSSSYFDDLRFYNISLTQLQLIDIMVSNETNCSSTTTTTTTFTTPTTTTTTTFTTTSSTTITAFTTSTSATAAGTCM